MHILYSNHENKSIEKVNISQRLEYNIIYDYGGYYEDKIF